MGGGPRTFPGGVSKYQWTRMLKKKKRERDKAWLAKERELYERRRRAQIMSLMPVRPWEKLPPQVSSSISSKIIPAVDRDPKVREMARRFQHPWRGLDLWKKADGQERCAASAYDQSAKGSVPKPIGTDGFVPLPLSVSQRVVELSKGELAGGELHHRREQPAGSSSELWRGDEQRRSLLRSYFQRQGEVVGLKSAVEVNHKQPNPELGERTDFASWMAALESSEWRQKNPRSGAETEVKNEDLVDIAQTGTDEQPICIPF